MNFEQFYYLQETNVNFNDYKYYGITPKDEEHVQRLKEKYHQTTDKQAKSVIEHMFEDFYQRIVGYNPVLNNINILQPRYLSKNTPIMDLVHGVTSGIPPEDIKNFIEIAKGDGSNIQKGYTVDPKKYGKYIKLIQNETSQSAAIQGNNFGDFPMTTFQAAPEMLPIPGSNTANPIKKRKKVYIKPGNRKPLAKYNVGRVNMATTMLPYQGNGYSL